MADLRNTSMLYKLLPGLLWLQGYRRDMFKSDIVAGVTIAFMLIPQGMAYAVVAGLPPEYGLYACVVPPVIYSLLGTSNKISMGPVALDSILILTGLSVLAEPGSDQYLELAIALTFLVGVIQSCLGFLRFGFLANFLSHPVIVGYTSAAALIIMGSQLESLLGVKVQGGNIFQLVYQLLQQFTHWSWATVGVGVFGLLFMILPKQIFPALPAALLLMMLGMLAAGFGDARSYGVDVIDYVPQGMPSLNMPTLSVSEYSRLFPVALTVALMGYVGTMSICKSQEKLTDKISTQPNQELVAVGLANFVGALFKAFPVSASFSRSAAFRAAGSLTQVSAVTSSLFIIIVILYLTPLFQQFPLPKALLSAIIIVSVAGLFKYALMKQLCQQNKLEFILLMVTFWMTLLLGVQQGLLIGVALSILILIYNTANPHMTELGAVGDGIYRNTSRFSQAVIRNDILIFRFDAPLYFANKDFFVQKVYHWIQERNSNVLRYVVFDAEAVNSIDSTAIIMLQRMIENLGEQHIKFIITNPIGPVRDAIKESPLHAYMCEESIFSTINDAIVFIDEGINRHPQHALQTNSQL